MLGSAGCARSIVIRPATGIAVYRPVGESAYGLAPYTGNASARPTLIGANTGAKFLEVECADDYYESIDMASALHPQSLFCYEMYGQPLDRGHGAPLRLQMPTKLGYKQAKYLDTIRVTNVLKPGKTGYWEDQGYSWFGGL